MNLWKVGACCLLAGSLYACTSDTEGTILTPDPVAGFRYVNLVTDTGAMDFRIIDVIQNAPNQTQAAFRTGGLMSGISTNVLPQHQAVLADGTPRHIRVFMFGTTAAVASTIMFDTTFTFTQGAKYTMYLYGSARTAGGIRARIDLDTIIATPANGKINLRVLNLAPDLTGNPGGVATAAGYAVDGRVGLTNTAVPIPGTAAFSNVAYGGLTPYIALDTTSATTFYRMQLTLNGATAPTLFQTVVPQGTRGNATTNPLAGSAVVGTAITAVIVPRSTPASQAPQTTPAAVTTNIDSIVRSNDTVTVWRRITPATATACAAPAAAGAAASDIVNLTGLTQPEYNGSQAVISVTAGTVQTLYPQRTVTLTGAAGAFTLSFGGQTTANLPFNATAAQVETALGALSTVGAANVSVTGAAGGPYAVVMMGTFVNTTPGALSASAAGGLTAGVTTPAVGCGATPLQTAATITFTGAAAPADSFRVTVSGQTTPYLSVGATAAQVQTAIAALSTVGTAAGNVAVTGAAGGPYVATFGGTLNNQNVPITVAMFTPTAATVAVTKGAFAFAGPATSSRFRFRIAGTPVSPATGTASFKIATAGATADYLIPSVIYMIDQNPPRTAP